MFQVEGFVQGHLWLDWRTLLYTNPQADTPPTIEEPAPGRPLRSRRIGPADSGYDARAVMMSRRMSTTAHTAPFHSVKEINS